MTMTPAEARLRARLALVPAAHAHKVCIVEQGDLRAVLDALTALRASYEERERVITQAATHRADDCQGCMVVAQLRRQAVQERRLYAMVDDLQAQRRMT